MIKKRFKSIVIKSRSGTTMVEVLVSFLVVVIMMALFAKIVVASAGMLQRSRNIIRSEEKFEEVYYKTAERSNRKNVSSSLILSLDTERTSSSNKAREVEINLAEARLQVYEDFDTGMKRYSFWRSDIK